MSILNIPILNISALSLSARNMSLRPLSAYSLLWPSSTAAQPVRRMSGQRVRRGRPAMLLCLGTLLLGATPRAHSQLTLTLPANPLVIDAAQGGTATFTATLTNNFAYDLYLNSDSYALFTPATLDDTLFQNYFAAPPGGIQPVLTANGGTLTLDLFTVSLPANTTPGIYSGTITLQGGADTLTTDNLDAEQFAVQAVLPAASAVPEPGSAMTLTALLCGVGMTAGRGLYRRIRISLDA